MTSTTIPVAPEHTFYVGNPYQRRAIEEGVSFYGILNEKSDYRVHVGFEARKLYIFPTAWAVDDICQNDFAIKIQTAAASKGVGFIVPPGALTYWQEIPFDEDMMAVFHRYGGDKLRFEPSSTKALAAEEVAIILFSNYGIESSRITKKQTQIDGADLLITNRFDVKKLVQVKCDFGGGRGATGRLYLQFGETNPDNQI